MLIKDLAAVSIAGRCFHDDSVLRFFPGDGHRLSFVFGGNGSGKSTLSSAFSMKKSGALPEGISAFSLLDSEGSVLADESEVLANTYVFNEDFVDEKVRVTGSGLKSIVMLGEAGELSDKIAEATDEKAAIDARLQVAEASLLAYDDADNPASSAYWRREIIDSLAGNGKWSDREKRIRQNQRAPSVSSSVVESIEELPIPERSREDIERELEAGIEQVVKLTEGSKLPGVPEIPHALSAFSETDVIALLSRKIDEPLLSDREKRLLEIAQKVGTSRLSESREYFTDGTASYCPFCFRDMAGADAEDLVQSISLVLNEAAEKHKGELSELTFPKLSMDLDAFSELNAKTVESCKDLVDAINSLIAQYESLVADKAGNLYTPKTVEPLGVGEALIALESKLSELERLRLEWNDAIDEKAALVARLRELNLNLARIDIDRPMKKLSESERAKAALARTVAEQREQSEELAKKIADYEAQKSSIKVALDKINAALAFVFLDKDHLVLRGSNGEYRLLSYGVDVRPQDVSTGERNAIALCYFFTSIGEGKSAEAAYGNEMLLVVDDPISSFDQENRIGILSYMREQFKAVLRSNPYSKILCLTHDGYSMGAFYRVREEIMHSVKRALPGKAMKDPDCFALSNGEISNWALTNMRYGEMLQRMYQYSLNPQDNLRPFMGNLTRRALEAFSTFEFNMGVSTFADSTEALDRVHSDALKAYFSNLMFHLVLHNESHAEDPVKIEGIVETVPVYTPDTIDRIVRDTLCLIYSMNANHVLTHLSECENAKQTIELWISDIESTLSSNARD